MFLRHIKEFLGRFPAMLRSIWLVGFLLFFVGGGLNLLVIHANGGMPVPTKAEGFFVIYPKYYRAAFEVMPDRMLIEGRAKGYVVMTERSRFKVLADRFYLVTPINIWRSLPSWLTIQFSRSDVPVIGQEMQASIGDIIIWIGDILILISALASVALILARGFQYQRSKV